MKKFKLKTDFKNQLLIVVISLLILIGILSFQFNSTNQHIISTIIGFLIIVVAVLSFIGFYRSIKRLTKPRSTRRIGLLLVISITLSLILYLVVENLLDSLQIF